MRNDEVKTAILYAWGGTFDREEWIRHAVVEKMDWKYDVFWDRDSIPFGESIDRAVVMALGSMPIKVFCVCEEDYLKSAND